MALVKLVLLHRAADVNDLRIPPDDRTAPGSTASASTANGGCISALKTAAPLTLKLLIITKRVRP